jgi:hypothetical protein
MIGCDWFPFVRLTTRGRVPRSLARQRSKSYAAGVCSRPALLRTVARRVWERSPSTIDGSLEASERRGTRTARVP